MSFRVRPGSFTAIVGRVGSGKSSLLQALIGEMRRTRGSVVFSAPVAYVPQTAWIRNATLRENVLFGAVEDEGRFREVVRVCALEHDLEMLPNGEDTEIGEKGITLSGGQKARVSLARAVYSGAPVVLLDDPLSAVDAHVGKRILEECLLDGPLKGTTRVLVTHQLGVLDKVDEVWVMEEGKIIERGAYRHLMSESIVFKRLMEEYGNLEKAEIQSSEPAALEEVKKKIDEPKDAHLKQDDKKAERTALMQTEERNTGAVTWNTYASYLRYAGSLVWGPTILGLLLLSQAAAVGNNLFLGFWTDEQIKGFTQGDYMAVYAALGVAQAALSFGSSLSMA
jgi:ABC-type multidrug transport system ATPase subunit